MSQSGVLRLLYRDRYPSVRIVATGVLYRCLSVVERRTFANRSVTARSPAPGAWALWADAVQGGAAVQGAQGPAVGAEVCTRPYNTVRFLDFTHRIYRL